jgi:tetratricopeptide (TPR) repeat protein
LSVSAHSVEALGALVWALAAILGSGAAQQPVAPPEATSALASRVVDLPRAPLGAHSGWQARQLPPLYDLAVASYGQGDTPRAVELLTLLLQRDPDFPPALLMLGGMHFRLRRYDDAVHAYQRFLEHAPEEVERTRHLGHALHSLGRHTEARVHYDAVLARPPAEGGLAGEARAFALRGRGLALHRVGELELARESLLAARALHPNDSAVHFALAQVDEERGALADALESARSARALAPFDPGPAFLLATLLAELGRPDEAAAERAAFARLVPLAAEIDDLELRLLHLPHDRSALAKLARCHAALGDLGGVTRAVRRLGPATIEGARLTLELLAETDPAAAEVAERRLTTEHAADPAAWDALAEHFGRRGDTAGREAAAARAAALRRSP